MAGRQGFEPGAGPVSNVVMARDFWLKRFNHRRLCRSDSFTAVHQSPPDSAAVVETFWRRPCARNAQTGAVSNATCTESDSDTEKLSFSKPITRPERSFISTTSSPVSSDTYSSEGSVNQTVSV